MLYQVANWSFQMLRSRLLVDPFHAAALLDYMPVEFLVLHEKTVMATLFLAACLFIAFENARYKVFLPTAPATVAS